MVSKEQTVHSRADVFPQQARWAIENLPLGIIHALSLITANAAYCYNPVAYIHLVKVGSFAPLDMAGGVGGSC